MDMRYFRAIQGSLDSPNRVETQRRKAVHDVKRDTLKSLDRDLFLLWQNGVLTGKEIFLNPDKKEMSTVIGQKQEFTCMIDTEVKVGDILWCPREKKYWLVMYVTQMDYIYKKGLMYRCNAVLKWRDPSGTVWEYPAHSENATQYNNGIEQGRSVSFVTSQHKVLTTADDNILALKIDTRFFLGKGKAIPEVYKLTQNDTSSLDFDKGIASLTLFRDLFHPERDDAENRLCDEFPDIKNVPEQSGTILFSGEAAIRLGGRKTIRVENSIDGAEWSIAEPELEDAVSLMASEKTPEQCVIRITVTKEAISLVGTPFTVVYKCGEKVLASQRFLIIGGA